MAEQDELNVDELTADLDVDDAEDIAVEPIETPFEPAEDLLDKKNAVFHEYQTGVLNELRDQDTINGVESSKADLLERTAKIVGDRGIIVGDQPGEGLVPSVLGSSYVSAFSRLHPTYGTIPVYQAAEQRSLEEQSDNLYSRSWDFFGNPVDLSLFPTSDATYAQGITDEEGKLYDPEGQKQLLGVDITNERLENLVEIATTVSTLYGAVRGGISGLPGGPLGVVGNAVMGGLLAGASGMALSSGGAVVIESLASVPGEYSRTDHLMDLAKRGYTNFGLGDDFVDLYLITSDEIRNAMVTNIVETADVLGVKKAAELLDEYGIVDFEGLKKQTKESLDAYETELNDRVYGPKDMQPGAPVGPMGLFNVLFLNPVFRDKFLRGLSEVKAEILENPEYRDARAGVRQDALTKTKIELDLQSRNQKPTEKDRLLITPYELYKLGRRSEEERSNQVQQAIKQISYIELHPGLQKEQPDVDLFKQAVSLIPPDHPLMTSDVDPNLFAAIESVHMQQSDDQIQATLNTVPFGIFSSQYLFEEIVSKSIPSQKEVDRWAASMVKTLEATGSIGARRLGEAGFRLFMEEVDDPKYGTYFKRSTIGDILNWAGAVTSGAAEVEYSLTDNWITQIVGTNDVLKPLVESMGLPNGLYVPTPAGLDKMLQRGIRNPDADFLTRFDARMDAALGGFQIGYAEIAASYRWKPGDIQYNLLQNLGMYLDMFLNLEKSMMKGAGRVGRTVLNAPAAKRAFTDAPAGQKAQTAKEVLLTGVVDYGSGDPLIRMNALIKAGLDDRKNRGLRNFQALPPAEKELVRRILLLTERDPDKYIAADILSSTDTAAIQKVARKLIDELGPSEVSAFRSDGSYQRIERQVQDLVDQKQITINDKHRFMAMIETQAFRIAEQPDTPFQTPIQVLHNLAVTRNRAAGSTARFMGKAVDDVAEVADVSGEQVVLRLVDKSDDPDIRFARQNDIPTGYFEYNPTTRRSIINLFSNGDIDTLWHENGHFMSALMGEQWNQRIKQFFDHTVDNNGVRQLSDLGHEQFAEAWRYYRRVKDAANGTLRRLFDELWIGLHNLYSRIRKKPGLLPRQVREFWDLEFGTLPADRLSVDALVSKVVRRRPRVIFVDGDARERVRQRRPAAQSREELAKEPSMNPTVLHQYLGDKLVTKVDVVTDPVTGQTQRIPRRVYADTTDDPVDVLNKVIAYIKTDRYRKQISKTKTVQVGTGKYIVPIIRQKAIHETVLKRLIDVLGSMPAELAKRLFQKSPDGYVKRGNVPGFVSQADFDAFDARQRMRHPGPRRLTDETIKTTEFFALTDREQAGMRTLLQEISKEPASDILPISVLDPQANLRILALDEYDLIIKVMQDIEAGPLNRSGRGTIQPGFVRRLGAALSRKEFAKQLGDRMVKLADLFTREKLRFNVKNANPDLVDIFEKYIRLTKKSPEELINAMETARKKGVEHFVNFYKDQISLFVPLVDLSKAPKLFRIVGVFNKLKTGMDADAFAKQRAQQQITGTPSRIVPDVVASSGGPGSFDINYVFRHLVDIQDLLDGPYGMTRLERNALIELRTLRAKYANKQRLSDVDNHIAADAIQVLHNGLLEKHAFVYQTATDVFKIAMGVEGQRVDWSFTDGEILRLYRSYYDGDLMEMYDIGSNRSLIPLDLDAAKKAFGDSVSVQEIDAIAMLTNVLVYGKMSELRRGLARELAEKGYNLNRRKIFETMALESDLGEVPGLDRQKYLDRVTFYIHEELSFQDKVVLDSVTRKVKALPGKPSKEMYGPGEVQPSVKDHPDTKIITRLDKSAKDEASRILDMLGVRRELGTFNVLRLGDDTFLLPESLIEGIEEAFSENLKAPYKFKRNFGRTGSVEYSLLDDMPPLPVSFIRTLKDARDLIWTISPHKTFYSGLLIGSGGVPMVPYMFGVFAGTVSQIQLGQGVLAAAKDAAAFPGVMTEAVRSYNNLKEANFVSGVLARTFGEGNHKPITKPYILKDGRILTADGLANAIIEEGIKGAFVGVLSNTNVHDRVLETFGKSNPWVGGTAIGGTLGGMLGLVGGPVGAAAGAAAGAAVGGFTLGVLLKRGNWFTKAHRFYAEASTAIDTYFRIRAIVREMDESGSTIQKAAQKVRDVVLDYSDMSDFEKKWFQQAFAFYVYFKQAAKLFVKSLMEHPDRVLTQLKIARASQLAVTDLEDPERTLSPWDRTRTFIPWKIGDHAVRLPYLITADVISLIVEFVIGAPGLVALDLMGPEETEQSQRNFLARANPFVVEAYKAILGEDLRGFEIERSKKQIPAFIVQMDLDIFGGVLHDKWGITHVPYDKIKTSYADQDPGERINTKNLEMPGRGMWIATKPGKAIFWLDFVQSPVTGRPLDIIEAIDRSNIGLIEAMVRASDAYYQMDKKRPLLARIPGLVELGVVKPERRFGEQFLGEQKVNIARPTDVFDPNIAPGVQGHLDTATAHRAMREDFSYEGPEGLSYKLRYKDFYPLYLLKIAGLSSVYVGDRKRQSARNVKRHLNELEEKKRQLE